MICSFSIPVMSSLVNELQERQMEDENNQGN